jgi:hypothetical protein
MTAEEIFEAKREAFRKWIVKEDFTKAQLVGLISDCYSRVEYMDALESVFKNGFDAAVNN